MYQRFVTDQAYDIQRITPPQACQENIAGKGERNVFIHPEIKKHSSAHLA
jgi:hypothetical protein